MKRLLSITSIALLLALSSSGVLKAEISAPDRALETAATKNKLLNTPSPSFRQRRQITVPREHGETFEQQMDNAGWNVSKPATRYFYNARKVIAQQQLMRVEDEINQKFYEANRTSRSLDSSA